MKLIYSILLTILTLPIFAQVEGIPFEYQDDLLELDDMVQRQLDSFPITLDPIDRLLLPASYEELENNWGYEYLNVDNLKIIPKATVWIYVIDTDDKWEEGALAGFALNNRGKNFTTDPPTAVNHWHSTHVAGCIAAKVDGRKLGPAADYSSHIKGIPYKSLNVSGSGFTNWIAGAILSAVDDSKAHRAASGKVIINMSLGGGFSQDIENAIKVAKENGILVISANGNSGGTPASHPGSSAFGIGIAALQKTAAGVDRAPYSQYGSTTFGAAPGSAILSVVPGGGLAKANGTSMATPMFASIAALLWSHYPNLSADDLVGHLSKYATDLGTAGRDVYYGFGSPILKPYLDNAPGGSPPPPPPPPPPTEELREERQINIYAGKFVIPWRRINEGKMNYDTVFLTAAIKTKLLDDAAYLKMTAATTAFMTNRGYVLSANHGVNDLGWVLTTFYEMLMPQLHGVDVSVDIIEIKSGSRTFIFDKDVTKPYKAKGNLRAVKNKFLRPQTTTWK